MKSLASLFAFAVNRALGRTGRVLADRYHLRVLKCPRQVRNAIAYVLLNARKHGIRIPFGQPDPFSSGPWFGFWRGRRGAFRCDESPVAAPRISIMVELVCLNMPVGLDDQPGTSLECIG